MLIKCKQLREGGTEIDLGGTIYHFAPNKDGDHVCDVTDKADIERLLAITEGFEKTAGKSAKGAGDAAVAEAAPAEPEKQAETAAEVEQPAAKAPTRTKKQPAAKKG